MTDADLCNLAWWIIVLQLGRGDVSIVCWVMRTLSRRLVHNSTRIVMLECIGLVRVRFARYRATWLRIGEMSYGVRCPGCALIKNQSIQW